MQLLEQCQGYISQLDSIDVESIPQLDSRDPTGTADLRAAFERELKDRWQRLDRYLSNAVATSDVLSLSPNGAMALIPAADRTRQFRSWLDELLSHLIVAGGDWMKPYLDEAGERASSRAAGLDPRKAVDPGAKVLKSALKPEEATPALRRDVKETLFQAGLARATERGKVEQLREETNSVEESPISWKNAVDRFAEIKGYDIVRHSPAEVVVKNLSKIKVADAAVFDGQTEDTISVLATSELQGICDAYAQQATRIAAHAALVRWRPAKAAQGIRQLTATVGLARSRMMADYLIVKAFGCTTLEAFREAGVRHVGTIPEMVQHSHMQDAGPEDEPRNERGEWTAGGGASGGLKIKRWGPDNAYTILPIRHEVDEGATASSFHIEPDGSAVLRTSLKSPSENYVNRAIDAFLSPLATNQFIRLTHKKEDYDHLKNGTHRGSINYATGEKEAGLSVAKHLGEFSAKYAYLVEGTQIGSGSDSEPVVETGTARVASPLMKYEKMQEWYDKEQDTRAGQMGIGPKMLRALRGGTHRLLSPEAYSKETETTVVSDAARKTPQHRHPVHGRFITKTEATREWGRRSSGKFGKAPKVYNRSIAHRKALRAAAAAGEEEVNVQTAGDDKVCQACQAISNAGPYPIDEAMDLIPAHPNCRCAYVPAGFKGGSNPLGIHT
jgi:hypothetical protein